MTPSLRLTRFPSLFALFGILIGGASSLVADDPADELVEMCHRGVTITVQRRFLAQRLELGDTLGACDCCGSRQGLVFDKEIYSVRPDEAFVVQVCICPAPPAGLFSYGVEVTLEGGDFSGTGFAVSVPAELNFHTVRGPGADTAANPQALFAKGSVDFFKEPLAVHRSSMIASLRLPGLPAGRYTLSLKPRNDLGLTEQIFIDGNGTVLDETLNFLPSEVIVRASDPLVAAPEDAGNAPFRFSVVSCQRLTSGAISLEFSTEGGREYFIQYSHDLANWVTVLPAILGTGAAVPWIDDGPPTTDSRPPDSGLRFYRLLRIEP